MIALPRSLARLLRAVYHKSAPVGSPRGRKPPIVLEAGKHGLCARVQLPDVAVEYQHHGSHPLDVITLPLDALDEFTGRQDVPITLEKDRSETIVARWDEGGIPQVRQYTSAKVESQTPFPDPPARFIPLDPVLLQALDAARQCVSRDPVRYALQKLQLRGNSSGEIVASDGRQLLVQKGIAWPWKDDVLVPAVSIFGCLELPPDGQVSVGRTEKHIVIRVGPWTVYLGIDAEGRYPKVEKSIPSVTGMHTTCRLSHEDSEFLGRTLPRLPGGDMHSPITIDLNDNVAVRARGENQERSTELVLARSTVEGPPVRFMTNRQYLARMVQLGLFEMKVVKADVPVVCMDAARTFVWMPLGKDGAIPPSDDCLRIASTGKPPKISPIKKERRIIPMPPPSSNGSKNGHVASTPAASNEPGSKTPSSNGLMEEAAELKSLLRDAYVRVGQLLEGLKRQRHQSRLLRSTLTTLKQLQQLPE